MATVEGGGAGGAVVRYRNREIGEAELTFLRECIAGAQGRTVRDLSREICQAWGWRQRNGALSEYACRDLLLRLGSGGICSCRPRGGESRRSGDGGRTYRWS